MDVKKKLVELLRVHPCTNVDCEKCEKFQTDCWLIELADQLIANGVTVQERGQWQYIDEEVDEDNNIQAYCSECGAGDKHATSMIGKVLYCWKCGRKMLPQLQRGE